MKRFALALAATTVFACSAPDNAHEAPPPSPNAPSVSPAALEVERAIRDLEAARDLPSVRARLESALSDATLPAPTRDQATLALARALDALGEKEKAIETVEALLAKHVDDHPWGLEEQADELLQKLVTGSVAHPPHDESARSPAPVAFALAKHFPVKEGKLKYSLHLLGGNRVLSDRLGTFAISDAVRSARREACPLCDDKLSAHGSESRSDTWTRIPAERHRYDDALVVFYFDLGARKIPSRYDALLPLPSADVVARLEKGEGVVAVKSREGAPPLVLLAAPRDAQLADVEEAFAAMKSLPTAPVSVAVSPALRPREIQSVVRTARPAMKACADALLAKTKDASGKVVLRLEVQGDGSASGVKVEPTTAKLEDAPFLECLEKAAASLVFPKTGQKTSVTYPVTIAPST